MALRTLPPRLSPAPQTRAAPRNSEGGAHRCFYRSGEWRAFRDGVFRQRGARCEKCGATCGRLILDHIVELKDAGERLDRRNVMILCGPCHNRKTAAALRERMR